MSYEKNVASQKVGFVMVDKTDFATPETGISPSAVIRKDGGASAALSNTVSELSSGEYVVTLSQGETNADLLQLRFHDSAASCASQHIVIATDKGKLASILADTITLSNATYGLDALETITSQTLAALGGSGSGLSASISTILAGTTSILADTITLSNATYGLDALESLCSQILQDTGTTIPGTITTLENRSQSILADTITLSNATYGLNALETITSHIESTLDDVIGSQIASILADTKTLSNATYGLDALETITSDILEDTAALATVVNAQVLDVLGTDTFGEPATGAPGATISIEEKISWLYSLFRNKTLTTATLLTLRNDADNADIAKATLSDNATTFTKEEFVSG